MNKIFLILELVVFCLLMNSCKIETLVCLYPYHPYSVIRDDIVIGERDTVTIISRISDVYDTLCEPEWDDKDKYTVYKIDIYTGGIQTRIELGSVSVTECGVPIPTSIFYRNHYPGSWKKKPVMVSSFPLMLKNQYAGYSFYVKIKKQEKDIQELTIQYQINIDARPVIEKHQYRKRLIICTKKFDLYKHWLRTCEE